MNDATIIQKLTRLESRIVVGFEQLGVDVKSKGERMVIDHERRVISVPSGGTSLRSLLKHIPYDEDAAYRIEIEGEPVCYIGNYTG